MQHISTIYNEFIKLIIKWAIYLINFTMKFNAIDRLNLNIKNDRNFDSFLHPLEFLISNLRGNLLYQLKDLKKF